MLVLSREKGESIYFGDDIRISVLGVQGGKVRLGITAPPNVAVHRDTVYEKLKHTKPSRGGPVREPHPSVLTDGLAHRVRRKNAAPPASDDDRKV